MDTITSCTCAYKCRPHKRTLMTQKHADISATHMLYEIDASPVGRQINAINVANYVFVFKTNVLTSE